LPAAASPLEALTSGGFRASLDDPEISDGAAVRRVIFCSGKVYYDLRTEREKRRDARIAIVRVEQLYPFPASELAGILARFPSAGETLWVQEEPRNMGAWSFVRERAEGFLPGGTGLRYIGRAASPSPATGNAAVHKRELEQFLSEALSV
jgi:2-oxoglutarate dehydrogenase complex dehydrogenase (E1) component-like enzyme